MILITEFMNEKAVDLLRSKYDVIYDKSLADNQEKIPDMMKDIKAIIVRNRTQINENLLNHSPNLLCVGRLGVGLDNIDLESCKERNLTVYPATGANTNGVVEYVFTSALILLRGAFNKTEEMVSGKWPREQSSGNEITGKVLGLVGFGEIAQKTADLARSFNMEIMAFDPFLDKKSSAWNNVKNVDLEKLLKGSDVISIHTPLSESTRHLINSTNLNFMKKTAVIINAARGGVIDDKALSEKLRKDEIKGAALDVFENEPMDVNSGGYFHGLKNVILTPHIAGVTEESNVNVSAMIAYKIDQHLSSSI
jgi:(S)-sulfolactate dehydrogenase